MFSVRTCAHIFFVIGSLLSALFTTPAAYAAASSGNTTNSSSLQSPGTLGVAQIIQLKDNNTKDGSIISNSDHGVILTTTPYDPQVLGVVSRDAAIILNNNNTKSGLPVISIGTVYALVSSRDGAIRKGDLLASSTIPGVAVKAIKSGYVLGAALEDYSSPDPKKIDSIAVDLNLHYFNSKPTFPGTLTDLYKYVLLPTKEGPSPIYKYIVAAIVVMGSFVLGFMSFGRTAAKGVEALGRNPAASRIIHLGIIFNVTIVVVIVLSGLTVAFLILRL